MSIEQLEREFKQKTIKLLNEFPNYPQGTYDLNSELKSFIYSYPDNQHVKNFIRRLATRYLKIFTNPDLINAFKLPISHFRNIKILSNLPLTVNRNYDTYLFNIFNFESKNFYDMCKSLIELSEIQTNELEDVYKIIDRCVQFENNNEVLMKASKSEYLDPKEEIANIEQVKKELDDYIAGKHNPFGEIVKTYAFLIKTNDLEFAAHSYINKKIGNLGEYITFDYIKGFDNSTFVARDLKDGFGYDMYFLDNGVETLVEVKTTSKSLEAVDEKFKLSQNEYNVMRKSLTNEATKYLVVKIELNQDYTMKNIVILETTDGITFNSRNVEGYCYRFSEFNDNGEAIFNRTVQKIKQK